LGQRTIWVKTLVAVAIVCLAGGAVAMAGSIGFVGLIVPHMVRRVLSADHRWLLPGCAVFGALLLLGADILSRIVIAPGELPIGAITAMIGAPVFVVMVRRGLRHA
ncbi:FecCD family ABC transporter permease, partial [Agrobacterium tumefaciens]|uniref:FecCD family ABC transporter permease n=1 Tax=Agrobacterium tumefaciens TaxID=358 RepID=UPI003BA05841